MYDPFVLYVRINLLSIFVYQLLVVGAVIKMSLVLQDNLKDNWDDDEDEEDEDSVEGEETKDTQTSTCVCVHARVSVYNLYHISCCK